MLGKVKTMKYVSRIADDILRDKLSYAGAGQIGEYSFCSYSVVGTGRFVPSDKAKPHVGIANKTEAVKEERIEVVCERSKVKTVIEAMRQAHPYEEVAFDSYPLLSEEEL